MGVACVLSTISGSLCFLAILLHASKSATSHEGLLTVSINKAFVFSLTAFSTASRSYWSTICTFTPRFPKKYVKRFTEPPYSLDDETISSPVPAMVLIAANSAKCPDEVTTA